MLSWRIHDNIPVSVETDKPAAPDRLSQLGVLWLQKWLQQSP